MTRPLRLAVAGAIAVAVVLALGWVAVGYRGSTLCTLIGGSNVLGVSVDPGALRSAAFIQLRLCHDDECEDLAFPVGTGGRRHPVAPGVGRTRNLFQIDLDRAFEGTYAEDDSARLTAVLLGPRSTGGVALLRTEESFDWEQTYPNGKDCDKTPFIFHETELAPRLASGSCPRSPPPTASSSLSCSTSSAPATASS